MESVTAVAIASVLVALIMRDVALCVLADRRATRANDELGERMADLEESMEELESWRAQSTSELATHTESIDEHARYIESAKAREGARR